MDIERDWGKIRRHFSRCFQHNYHVALASVDGEGNPTVTPIGSLFLHKDICGGFYFEKFPTKLPMNAAHHNQISVLAVNSGTLFWLKSLYRGRFDAYPAVKLYGYLGQRRLATEAEQEILQKRMRRTRWLKGHQYLWSSMNFVREVEFFHAEKVNLGEMTAHL